MHVHTHIRRHVRSYARNPLSRGGKVAIGIGVAAVLGMVALGVYEHHEHSKRASGGGAPGGPTTFTFINGHTYKMTIGAPTSMTLDPQTLVVDQGIVGTMLAPMGAKNVRLSEPDAHTLVIQFDYTGATRTQTIPDSIQQKLAAAGASWKIEDLGLTMQPGA